MIKLLSDNVANQIAAGEVVQRPASVVKELLENAIDAGATHLSLLIKDAGRTLIQVIDNGKGMSDTDARMSFERHATSKIRTAHDLEHITTFGFRGEALASIAAVAEVELKTRRAEDELGSHILIQASTVHAQELIQCSVGSNFSVKNLFFNIPARRKFLKSDAVELKHIISEFQRVSICHPGIAFSFVNNGNDLYNLTKGNLRQRLMALFGKSANNSLIDVGVDTAMIRIYGFVGKPEMARKSMGEQFFFVNNRFFRNAYFQKAVNKAYNQLLPPETFPSFFLFLEVDPSRIDVNIHPAKTEIKFEDEQAIWQMLDAVVRESLSRFAVAPSIIFDTEGAIDIPVLRTTTSVSHPSVKVDPTFNPFLNEKEPWTPATARSATQGWESLYRGFERQGKDLVDTSNDFSVDVTQQLAFDNNQIVTSSTEKRFLQIKGKYILTPVKSGLMLIDIVRAHQRILYEKYLSQLSDHTYASQQELYPQTLELDPGDYMLMQGALDSLEQVGFDIRSLGENTLVFYAFPAGMEQPDARLLTNEILHELKESYKASDLGLKERIARSLARTEALRGSNVMKELEMQHMIDQLFACSEPNVSADGKPVLSIIAMDELEKRLLK